VKTEALKWNLDPSFTYAVIRQESVFDPEVVSPAGAIGLMQIMPATGKTIARELGEPFSIESLYSPEVNIRYGTYYLYKLSKEFDNSREFTLAGYNGGPPKAKEWQERGRDKDPDLMIEGIVFSETRNYVKKVMANFWMYSQIMH
jgi:soluble lytic murein transglycosylase